MKLLCSKRALNLFKILVLPINSRSEDLARSQVVHSMLII